MKKIAVLLAVLAASFAGCQKPVLEEPVEVNDTFTASVEEFASQTKTSMNSNKQQLWSAGDELAIFRGNLVADEYKLADECAGTTSGIFKSVSGGAAGTAVPCNVAYYPYAEGQSLKATEAGYELSVELPETQLYAQNSYGVGAFPMVAVTTDVNDRVLKFKNVAGAMNLQFKGTQKVVSVKVEGNSGEALSGAAVVTADDTPSVKMQSAESAAVVLDCGEGVQLSETEATSFILALPPVELAKGFTVTILDADNLVYTVVSDAKNEILRSGILVMPEVNLAEVEGVPQGPTWGIVGAVNSWGESGADLPMSKTETEGLFVAKNVKMPAGAFKIRANGEWNDEANYGLEAAGTVMVDHVYDVITSGGSCDMTLAAGTYDIWFDLTNKKVYVMTPGKDISEAVAGGPGSASEWGVVGVVNGWNAPDITMYNTTTSGLFVVENLEMPAGAFKIRANGEWNDAANYGLETAGTVEVDHVYDVITGGGSGDMTLAAGTYDIWFDLTNKKVYVMTPGKPISEAVAGKAETPSLAAWYLVGNFNGWNAADSNYEMTVEGDWYVFKNFAADGQGVKFVADASWSVNRGGAFSSANTEISLSQNGSDMLVAAGTYDVYLSSDTKTAYFMSPGLTPGQTPEPDPTPDPTPDPEQPAEPEVDNNLYLNPNSNWKSDNARFAAYFFGNGEKWVSMTDLDGDGIYEVEKQAGYPKVIFCRMNPSSSANNWNNKWNQTGDLTIPTDGKNLFTLPNGAWDGSTSSWSVMSK